MTALVRMVRPHQWVKNVFVGAPLVFAYRLHDSDAVIRSAIAILAFCLLSGAVYAFNDVRDADSDRHHPTKSRRPVAAGQVSKRTALTVSAALAAIALIGSCAVNWHLGSFAALYVAQNVAYSVRLKRVAYVDVALITSGFLLRVLAGAAAIDVPASNWLLLCTGLLAALLALGKRAHELMSIERGEGATATRAALAGYNLPTIRRALLVLSAVTCGAYVAYTLDPHTIAMFGTHRLVWSAPFVAIGIARYLSLALWHPKPDPPTEAMLRDPIILIDVVAATAIVLYAIYGL